MGAVGTGPVRRGEGPVPGAGVQKQQGLPQVSILQTVCLTNLLTPFLTTFFEFVPYREAWQVLVGSLTGSVNLSEKVGRLC